MFFSIYPTDEIKVRRKVISQALKSGVTHFFTSLHIPESDDLNQFLEFLKENYNTNHITYTADIGSETLDKFHINFDGLLSLKECGIRGFRIDYGIEHEMIERLMDHNFEISINASTVTVKDIENFSRKNLIGWHNFYPRPYTGISEKYLEEQNQLLDNYQIEQKAFIPGEQYKRKPLHLGLPTLEKHREQNPYISYVELRKKHRIKDVGVAEGLLREDTLQWILDFENKNIITIPVNLIPEMEKDLTDIKFRVRIEQTDYSWRLEDTRRFGGIHYDIYNNKPEKSVEFGGIYLDGNCYERYQGEVHICHSKDDVPMNLHKIGHIKEGYLNLISLLNGRPWIKFTS